MRFPSLRRRDPNPDPFDSWPEDRDLPLRRHMSERNRRPSFHDFGPDDDYRLQRGHGRREPSPGHIKSSGGGRRLRSPPPYHAPDPPRRESRREPHPSRNDRDRYARDSHPRNAYDRARPARDYPPSPDPRDRHHRPSRREPSPEHRARRSRHDSPEPIHHSRGYAPPGYDRDGPDPRSSRRSRGAPPGAYDGDGDHDRRQRRHQSQPRDAGRDRSHTRNRAPPAVASHSPPRRRSTMPASSKAVAAPKAKGDAWWKHPMVQAGARTVFAAGAQAVLQNRKAEGPWLGAKGAKVATAALSAALADGLMSGEKKKR